jgi:hypothetical protein
MSQLKAGVVNASQSDEIASQAYLHCNNAPFSAKSFAMFVTSVPGCSVACVYAFEIRWRYSDLDLSPDVQLGKLTAWRRKCCCQRTYDESDSKLPQMLPQPAGLASPG